MTNKEIRNEILTKKGVGLYTGQTVIKVTPERLDSDIDKIQNATLLNQLITMENLALWKGGNTPEEKINHFFAVLRDAKEQLERETNGIAIKESK